MIYKSIDPPQSLLGASLIAAADAAAARTLLGLGTAAIEDADAFASSSAFVELADDVDFVEGELFGHLADFSNPHGVTAAQLGLGTAAMLNTGTASGEIPLLGANGYLYTDGLSTPWLNIQHNGGLIRVSSAPAASRPMSARRSRRL